MRGYFYLNNDLYPDKHHNVFAKVTVNLMKNIWNQPKHHWLIYDSFQINLTKHILHSKEFYRRQFNSSSPTQNDRFFIDDICKYIFINENLCILIQILLYFVPKGPINNIAAVDPIRAWRRTGDKPLSEPMMSKFTDAYMQH